MLATVLAAKMWDYNMFVCIRVVQKMTRADLDRVKAMRASLFSLLSEDNKGTTVLERSEDINAKERGQNTSSVA
jgi:hypothetical protein